MSESSQKKPADPQAATDKASAAGFDLTTYQVQDPEAFAQNMLKVMEQSQTVLGGFVDRSDDEIGPYSTSHELVEASKTMADIWQLWLQNPTRLAEAQSELAYSYIDLWQNTMRRMMGESVEPVDRPDRGDSRFLDPDWSANPYFDYWKQAYLITTHWAERLLDQTEDLDEDTRHRAEFHLRLVSTAVSPSNFPFTNPEVVRETFRTNAENLVQGMANLQRDLDASGELLKISQTDGTAFEVGTNLATTPGKVVFQSPLFQLIQYAPSTPEVYRTPILLVPPWINKFYILDLNEQKSFVKYLVGQGFTVFLMSWVNPGAELRDTTFEDYLELGVLQAAAKVREETGEPKCHTLGYCVGGTLLASTLAVQAARGEDIFTSATFLTTQVDFEHAGDLKIFTDEAQLSALEDLMDERGYLDGSRMATVFNMMRPRDLIWPYIVNNYMLGKTPIPFDLLYWNQDSTRMPAANHKFYLRKFYHDNLLSSGGLELCGVKLDLGNITIPIYDLAAREDHIAPAVSVYAGARLFGGDVEYVLAGSGHIAGVINPPNPAKPKYQYWTSKERPPRLADFIASATETPGSWWPHWIEWLSAKSGDMVPARPPGTRLGVLEDAPGSYVKLRH